MNEIYSGSKLENVYLSVESKFGSNMKEALLDCTTLARKLDIDVHTKIHGTVYMVSPYATDAGIITAITNSEKYVYVG